MTKPVVLVTGASRGIGHEIARVFLARGYPVAVGYCSHPAGTEDLAAEFPSSFPIHLDIGTRQSIRSALQKIYEHYGSGPGVLVNNGAVAQEKPFEQLTDEDWERMLRINLQGPFMLIQEVLTEMRRAHWGRIINIVSIGGQWGGMNQVHYAAAKAGLINLTRSVAKLFSIEGISCNAVSPGLVETAMTENELKSEAGKNKVSAIPAGRIGTVADVASAVLFLAGQESGYVTGQTINVNGGMIFG